MSPLTVVVNALVTAVLTLWLVAVALTPNPGFDPPPLHYVTVQP